jgi:hypothetical protein
MKGMHIVAVLVGILIGYFLGARFPSTIPLIGKASQ